MELLQTLFPSASHCIKCFCNFIRILCLCRCQSAVKLKLQTEILHFHSQRKLRKSIFSDRQRNGLTLSAGSFSIWVWGNAGLLSWEGGRKVALCFCHLSLAFWSTSVLHSSQEESFRAFPKVTHFSFSLFLWINRGRDGKALVLEKCRDFNNIIHLLKTRSFASALSYCFSSRCPGFTSLSAFWLLHLQVYLGIGL